MKSRTAQFFRTVKIVDAKKTTVKQRDITVEILRIVGCLLVVGTHTKLDLYVNGQPDFSRVFIYAVLADGVNIFWMILGFFCFNSKLTYIQQLKQMVLRILLPMVLFSAFCFYFGGWLIRGETLLQSVTHTGSEYLQLLTNGLLRWRPAIDYTGHLWFMLTYALIIVLMPALKWLNRIIGTKRKVKIIIATCILVIFAVNDVLLNGFCHFSYYGIGALIPAVCLVFLGRFLYEEKARVNRNWKWGSAGVVLFVAGNVLRTVLQYRCFMMPDAPSHLLQWYTAFGILSAVGIFLAVYGLGGYFKFGAKANKLICHLGKLTMYVYILHSLVLMFFYQKGVNLKIQSILGIRWYDEYLYLLLFGGGVGLVTLVIGETIFWTQKLVVKIVKTTKTNNDN